MSTWTFITNHAVVLSFIAASPMMTAYDLSEKCGITERAVRRIIADLDKEKYILKSKVGRRVRYSINYEVSLRHKTHMDKKVGDLLDVLKFFPSQKST